MLQITKKYSLPLLVLAVVIALVGLNLYQAYAVTTRNLSTQVDGKRYRVSYTDIAAASTVEGDTSVRKLTLFTLAPGSQLVSFVTKVTTGFTLPSGAQIYLNGIKAEQSGVQVSLGNLAATTLLNSPTFQNGVGDSLQYGIFSEDVATDIVIYINDNDGTDLSGLTAGSVDFLVTTFR